MPTPLQRFLALVNGKYSEIVPTSVGGPSAAGKVVALDGTTGLLDVTMLPTGMGPPTQTILASEAISAGKLVNIYNNSGTANCRNADGSTTGKQADGFVLSAVSQGGSATVYLAGLNTAVTGLTPGPAYLSESTVGGVSSTGAVTAGTTYQEVGVVTNAGVLEFTRGSPVIRA